MATPSTAGIGNQKGLGELWSRLKFLILAIIVYRIGSHIPVPGIDPLQLANIFNQTQNTIFGMANMFSGGSLERMSVLALGVMPYISASIIVQLLTSVVPQLEQLKKEGEQGRRKISKYTRYATVLLASVQALGMVSSLASNNALYTSGMGVQFLAAASFVTGSMFMMWLGEQITERGIGNGVSMLIFAGIVAGLPAAIGQALEQARQGELNVLLLIGIAIGVPALIFAIVFIERGQRRITVNYARRQVGRKVYQGQSTHLPLKVNVSGVIPAIFASSLLLFPATVAQMFGQRPGMEWLQDVALWIGPGQPLNILLFMFNPREVAENLKKSGAYVPGIRPGEYTARYIDNVLTRLTVVGAAYIAIVCLIPQGLVMAFNVPFYLGGTSLLIVVVVVMDFMSQVQSHLMSAQYDTLLKKANLKNYGGSSLAPKR
ncbi:MAG: preprotein translocase subunit SecY [Cellvibrionales bacterium]|nr:preprotein translocase subunit SecY [Cellvibrionales bacterium]